VSVVGIDLSLTSTGICLVDGSAQTWRIQSKGAKADTVAVRVQRLIDITNRVMDCIPQDVSLVVLEAPSLGQSRQAGEHLRAGLWWHLATSLHLQGHPVAEAPPATLKLYATGKGNSPKDHVLASVIKRYPDVDVDGNDIADATVLAAMGARRLGFPIEESLPQANQAALAKINWPEVG